MNLAKKWEPEKTEEKLVRWNVWGNVKRSRLHSSVSVLKKKTETLMLKLINSTQHLRKEDIKGYGTLTF